jgi:cbb3-type cytochrome oxidase subunit 3
MPLIGNKINSIYILVIFLFLVTWVLIMYNHKKNGEEHRSL